MAAGRRTRRSKAHPDSTARRRELWQMEADCKAASAAKKFAAAAALETRLPAARQAVQEEEAELLKRFRSVAPLKAAVDVAAAASDFGKAACAARARSS